MGMFVCVHDMGALPMVPEVKLDFAFPMVCYISAYGRPLTSLSFVCLRARDRYAAGFMPPLCVVVCCVVLCCVVLCCVVLS